MRTSLIKYGLRQELLDRPRVSFESVLERSSKAPAPTVPATETSPPPNHRIPSKLHTRYRQRKTIPHRQQPQIPQHLPIKQHHPNTQRRRRNPRQHHHAQRRKAPQLRPLATHVIHRPQHRVRHSHPPPLSPPPPSPRRPRPPHLVLPEPAKPIHRHRRLHHLIRQLHPKPRLPYPCAHLIVIREAPNQSLQPANLLEHRFRRCQRRSQPKPYTTHQPPPPPHPRHKVRRKTQRRQPRPHRQPPPLPPSPSQSMEPSPSPPADPQTIPSPASNIAAQHRYRCH